MATELNRTTSPAGAAEIEEVDEFDCYDYDCGSVMPGVLTDVDFPGGIRRCDTCEKFDGDLDAAQAAAELVGGTLWFQGAAYYRRDSGCSFLGWHVCARRLGSAPGVSITLGCVNLSGMCGLPHPNVVRSTGGAATCLSPAQHAEAVVGPTLESARHLEFGAILCAGGPGPRSHRCLPYVRPDVSSDPPPL
jgi:hypothetical protein